MMSDQVYIFKYHVHIQRPDGLAVKASGILVNDPGDVGSIPGKVKFLNFQNFNSYEVLGCSGAYIPSFGLK